MDERIEELFAFYALDALTEAERAEVDAYVAADPQARARLEALQAAGAALPLAVEPAAPPPRVKRALMAQVRADAGQAHTPAVPASRPRPEPFWRRFAPALALGGLALAVAASLWALTLNAEVVRLRAEAAVLRRELQAQAEVLAQVADPAAQIIVIAGTEARPAAAGRLIADPARNSGVLIVVGLAPLTPEQTYQLWLIKGAVPVSAGLFAVDAAGQATVTLQAGAAPADYDALGVSIEPAGGSEQPTGEIVLLGPLS